MTNGGGEGGGAASRFHSESDAFLDLCGRYGQDPDLVRAIISVESGWNSFAARYEPGWKWGLVEAEATAKRLKLSLATETAHQKTSWGLMQVMGVVAREEGYRGHLPRLVIPEVGVEYGLKKLARLANRYASVEDRIAAYNAGHAKKDPLTGLYLENQAYVDKVLRALN